MAADFNKPVTTDSYVDVLEMLRANQEVLARMFASGITAANIPVSAVRFEAGKFQTWDGAGWVDVPVSVDGGGTGAQSAAAARVALGTDDAANITKGTLTRNTTGNAATATYADSAGSATYAASAGSATYAASAGSAPWGGITGKPAVIASGATQQAARGAIGVAGSELQLVWSGTAKFVSLDTLPGGFPGDGTYLVNFGSAIGQIFLSGSTRTENVARILTIANATPAASSMNFYAIRCESPNKTIYVDNSKISGDGPTYTRIASEIYQIWKVV